MEHTTSSHMLMSTAFPPSPFNRQVFPVRSTNSNSGSRLVGFSQLSSAISCGLLVGLL
jgi:hypothetical protein